MYVNPSLPIYPSSNLATIRLFSISLTLISVLYLSSCVPFFKIPHISNTNDICPSLSDLLYSVRQYLGSSMLLRRALFHPFSWLSNSPLCLCVISSLSIPLLVEEKILNYFHQNF